MKDSGCPELGTEIAPPPRVCIHGYHQSQTLRKLGEPLRRPPSPEVGAPGPSSGKPQVFARPGIAATAPLPCPGRPLRQSIRRAHRVRPPAGCPHRPAGARSSELGLSASSPAARHRVPAPACAALRLTRASSGESLAAAARLLGAVAAAAGVAGARGGGRGGGAAEGPAHHQPQGTLPSPASNAAPRILGGALSLARGQGQVGSLATALRHCHRMLTREHAEPQTRSQIRRSRQETSQIQPQVDGGTSFLKIIVITMTLIDPDHQD